MLYEIRQQSLDLACDDYIPAQYSDNIEFQFVKDTEYLEYAVTPYIAYKVDSKYETYALEIDNDLKFTLPAQAFLNTGYIRLAFSLSYNGENVQTTVLRLWISESEGGVTVLPEDDATWQNLVTSLVSQLLSTVPTQTEFDALEVTVGANTSNIATNTTNIANNASDIATNENSITAIDTRVTATETKNTSQDTTIASNTTAIASNTTAIDDKVSKTATIVPDLNEARTAGSYFVNGSTANKPSGVTYANLIIFGGSSDQIQQLLIDKLNNNNMYIRRSNGPTDWTDWVKIPVQDDMDEKVDKTSFVLTGTTLTITID